MCTLFISYPAIDHLWPFFPRQWTEPDSLSGHAQEMSALSGVNTGPEPDSVAMAAGRQDHRG